jgi:hypothetical protein
MPIDLPVKALETGESSGWLRGARDTTDHVFVVSGLLLSTEDKVFSQFGDRSFAHHVFLIGRRPDRLLPWVVVRPGFARALAQGAISEVSELCNWLTATLPLEEILDEHLFLCCIETGIPAPMTSFILACAGTNGDSDTVLPLPIEWVGEGAEPGKRLDGLLPLDQLRTKQAGVVGLGSGGGFVALELASAGVGTLHLVDPDRLRTVNLFRHVCGEQDLGRSKVYAVADLIRQHQLSTDVHSHPKDVIEWVDQFRSFVDDADIVVGATDTAESRQLLNYVCVTMGTPLVLAGTYDSARIGEIIRVFPRRTACYECTRMALREAGGLIPDPDRTSRGIPYGAQTLMNEPTPAPGTRTDVAMVAAMQSRVAVMTLLDPEATGAGWLPRDYLAWGATRTQQFSEPFVFDYPFTVKFLTISRRIDCPVCGDLPDVLYEVDIEKSYASILESLEG